MNFKNFIVIFLSFLLILTTGCKAFKPSKVDLRKQPINAEERARKNVEEGRGLSIKNVMGGSKTTYEFSTSNPLWRASLEILDFIPLSTVDYSGGIIITDWYSEVNSEDSIKITVRFLSNTIAAESLKIIVHKKNCKPTQNCNVVLLTSTIKDEMAKSILSKASRLESELQSEKKN